MPPQVEILIALLILAVGFVVFRSFMRRQERRRVFDTAERQDRSTAEILADIDQQEKALEERRQALKHRQQEIQKELDSSNE